MSEPQPAPAQPTKASDVPHELWKIVLQHVPLSDRMGSASLVCQRMRAAAVAATDSLRVVQLDGTAQVIPAALSYINHHGSNLTSLHLERNSSAEPLEHLPCVNLRELKLSRWTLEMGEGASPCVFDGCTGLSHLDLFAGRCRSSSAGLEGLSVLRKLQHLSLENFFCFSHENGLNVHRVATFPGSILSVLTHLTFLYLSEVVVENLTCVSCLSSLSVLNVPCLSSSVSLEGGALPSSVCDLSLGDGVQLDCQLLSPHTQLTALRLDWVDFSKGAGCEGSLVSVLAGFRQLRRLELSGLGYYNDADVVWPPAGAAYSALRASCQLQGLTVFSWKLPPAVWEHVFAPSAPQLTGLSSLCTWDIYDELGEHFVAGLPGDGPCFWSDAALSRLAACAPNLQQLTVAVDHASLPSSLQRLSALTKLDLFYRPAELDEPDVALLMECLAELSPLQCLRLDFRLVDLPRRTTRWEWEALAPLIVLTALTQLQCITGRWWDRTLKLINKASAVDPPDVWRQLVDVSIPDIPGPAA